MTRRVNISMDAKWIDMIDQKRGDMDRGQYIRKIMKDHFARDRPDDAGDDELYRTLSAIESKLDRLTVIEARLDSLEHRLLADPPPPDDLKTEVLEMDDPPNEDVPEEDFSFGCSHCGATVGSSDSICPSCGGALDQERDNDVSLWESNDDTIYDPRPEREAGPQLAYQGARGGPDTYCVYCGGDLTYIEQYGRWYCYPCEKYGSSDIPAPAVANAPAPTSARGHYNPDRYNQSRGSRPLENYMKFGQGEPRPGPDADYSKKKKKLFG